jgi:RNA polymerase sigma factor (sigma-70 family)
MERYGRPSACLASGMALPPTGLVRRGNKRFRTHVWIDMIDAFTCVTRGSRCSSFPLALAASSAKRTHMPNGPLDEFELAKPGREWSADFRRRACDAFLHDTRMIDWVWALKLNDWYDHERLGGLWREFWERRANGAIEAFDGAGKPSVYETGPLVEFIGHVQGWTRDVEHRILCLAAREWTQLERDLVVRWSCEPHQSARLVLTAINALGPSYAYCAADGVQEAWRKQVHYFVKSSGILVTYEPRPDVSCDEAFLRLFGTCVKNACRDLRKKKGPDTPIENHGDGASTDLDDGLPAQLSQILKSERCQLLLACVSRLPDRYRDVVRLHLQDYTDAEIADELQISSGNVRIRFYRAKQILRSCLAPTIGVGAIGAQRS